MNGYNIVLDSGCSFIFVNAERFEFVDGRLLFYVGDIVVCVIRSRFITRLELWDDAVADFVEINF